MRVTENSAGMAQVHMHTNIMEKHTHQEICNIIRVVDIYSRRISTKTLETNHQTVRIWWKKNGMLCVHPAYDTRTRNTDDIKLNANSTSWNHLDTQGLHWKPWQSAETTYTFCTSKTGCMGSDSTSIRNFKRVCPELQSHELVEEGQKLMFVGTFDTY